MTEISRYIENQKKHIERLMAHPITAFTTPKGQIATWDEPAVIFNDAKGKSLNIYFSNNKVKHHRLNRKLQASELLPLELRHLYFAFTIEVVGNKYGISRKTQVLRKAREFLGKLKSNPAYITQALLESIVLETSDCSGLPPFINWLQENKMIPSALKVPVINKKEKKTGSDVVDHKKDKIPDTKLLLALGAIFHDVIPSDRSQWNTHSTANQRETFSCAMAAIAMASPNRVDAEQTVLTLQRLKSKDEVVRGTDESVHYLDWQGSKGFKANQKHFIDIMAEPVDRALEYMAIACEPARILARFYEKPSLPLKTVLGEFAPAHKNLKKLNPDMNKPISLIHLGYLLGFYDNGDGFVRVTPNTKGASFSVRGSHKIFTKEIVHLQPKDKLLIVDRCKYNTYLHGKAIGSSRAHINENLEAYYSNQASPRKVVTVTEFQNVMLKKSIENLKGFPIGYNKSAKGKCQYQYALFAFTTNQLMLGRNGQTANGGHYMLIPLSKLGDYFSSDMGKRSSTNLFVRHGFDSNFKLNPHQLRHWHNDIAEREGIPHSLINLWSGRKTPEQIMHYIHRTDAEKASAISDILYSNSGKDINIKVISSKKYKDACQTATSVTSTGICTQNLQTSPCSYLNDFATQCSLCSSSCHIAHDKDAIALLTRDLEAQERRLEKIANNPNFCSSENQQAWFSVHHRNTCMLRELVSLMSDKEIKEGSLIRVLTKSNKIHITDIDAKKVTHHQLNLPNTKSVLKKAIKECSKHLPAEKTMADYLSFL
ncbi:hypothetical protein [Photobacterium sp. OFAV2-7]|uniref:hypothetical protein n=1 Tax=Photobacterium sp. OFAV2-7 TaxID=2917748 RepID=UPI001EF5B89C|nr:hypothetical protein [Photobacterium sp. OFAV2-7]MCG7584429.1 hypothetical protein [Photobacterium sp. OFAV2-7]